jgi:phage terminase large subunit-like protein
VSASLLEEAIDAVGIETIAKALPPGAAKQLEYEWRAWARPEQLAPAGDWRVWLFLAGRGCGKTRTMNEWLREFAYTHPGARIAIIARTATDVRNTLLEGSSGLLNISPPWFEPKHEPSKMTVRWPNGTIAQTFSAEEPRGLRGPEFDAAICDELAAWPMLKDEDGEPGIPGAWTQLQYGMRRPGSRPRIVVATTPRPVPIIRELIKAPDVHVTRGKTEDNRRNLAPEFIKSIYDRYSGTRLGRQELNGEVLDDVEGALWNHTLIDNQRRPMPPELRRVVVAVDPSGSAKRTADEAGIVVAGIGDCPCLGRTEQHGFVLEDLTGRYSPRDMGKKAIDAYHKWEASRLVAEDNFGGKIIEDLVQLIDPRVAYKAVHASRGKIVRAEPVAALYEQGKVHHVGLFRELEDEMCVYAPLVSTESPGRMDALVWALTDLMLGEPLASFGDTSWRSPRRCL